MEQKLKDKVTELHEEYNHSYTDIEHSLCVIRVYLDTTDVEDIEKDSVERSLYRKFGLERAVRNTCVDIIDNTDLDKYEVDTIVYSVYEDVIDRRKEAQ